MIVKDVKFPGEYEWDLRSVTSPEGKPATVYAKSTFVVEPLFPGVETTETAMLALLERLVTRALNRREMHEHVVARLLRDEAVSLVGVEELHCAYCHHYLFSCLIQPTDDFARHP